MNTHQDHVSLSNVRRVDVHSGGVAARSVAWKGGRIAATDADAPGAVTKIDGGGRLLTPGLIDLHCHGIEQFVYDRGPSDVLQASIRLPRYGVTVAYPTLVPRAGEEYVRLLSDVADCLHKAEGARFPGLHLEGPFVKLAGAACWTHPGDVVLLEELLAATKGKTRIMSISPDTTGIIPIIERLRERNVVPFMTHTAADVVQTERAIDAGARHATHFYDVFPCPPVTEPGVRPAGTVEAILADARTSVDFITDGCHCHPVAIRMAVRALGWKNVVSITDSNIGAGLPEGVYPTPWGYPVYVKEGHGARRHEPGHPQHNGLAGSALTANVGMKNLLKWLDLPERKIWAMGTSNPARVVGLRGAGRLARGAPADLVLWNEDLTPARVWVGGKQVYPAQ